MTANPRRPASPRSRQRKKLQVHQAPLAIASDDTMLVDMHHCDGSLDLQLLLEQAADLGVAVFIGIVVRPKEHPQALLQLG
jgi:hypothetical protein